MNGLDEIANAAAALREADAPTRVRLARGARLLWSATYFRDRWPRVPRRQLATLLSDILCYGSIEAAAAAVSETEAEELADALLDWAVAFERSQREGLPAGEARAASSESTGSAADRQFTGRQAASTRNTCLQG